MSIATKCGDGGETGRAGGVRVSHANPWVARHGAIDAWISQMGFARSIRRDENRGRLKAPRRDSYKMGPVQMGVARDARVDRMDAQPGVASRTICRREERFARTLPAADTRVPRWPRAW